MIVKYTTPQDYLSATENFFLQQEVLHNMMLGICYAIPNKDEAIDGFEFYNIIQQNEIRVTAMLIQSRLFVAGNTNDMDDLHELWLFIETNNSIVDVVFGEKNYANLFVICSTLQKEIATRLYLYQLEKVNNIKENEGIFREATMQDLDILTQYTIMYEEELNVFPPKSVDKIKKQIASRILQKEIYCWQVNEDIVSMACIMRKLKTVAVIGNVFTLDKYRNNHFATNLVAALSHLILENKYETCALFANEANEKANEMYQHIGYHLVKEFDEIILK